MNFPPAQVERFCRITGARADWITSDNADFGGPNSEGGRYRLMSVSTSLDTPDLVEALAECQALALSDDPIDRSLLYALMYVLAHSIDVLPDTWVVYSTYKSGWGGEGRIAVWSAHATKAEATRWRKAWDEHWTKKDAWRKGGTDYVTRIAQAKTLKGRYGSRSVSASYFRNPEADPKECIRD